MNTRIGTSFGLAMLMLIGALAVMFVMGVLTPKPASAAIGGIDVAITPATAKSTGQYTITVTGSGGATGITGVDVGGTITVTFGSNFTVPSSIAASAIKLKAAVVSNSGTGNRLVSAADVTVDGRAVTITVPDMDTATSTGDNGIAASSGATGGNFIITFTQAAGIVNPNVAQSAYVAADTKVAKKTLTVKTSASGETTAVTAASQTAIASFTKFTPSTAARGATLTVTGGGYAATCADCKIRLNPQATTAPTTGAGGTAFDGSGTIDSTGVFSGTILLGSGTRSGGYVWVEDKTGTDYVSTTAFVQKAGATPRSTEAKPGGTVTVDLVDYTNSSAITAGNITISGTALTALSSSSATTTGSTGATTTLTPIKFAVPAATQAGTHKVVITDAASKSANFDLTVSLRSLTVTPATAVPGQSITISGEGFTKSGTIAADALTMKAGTVTTTASVNPSDAIQIDSTGSFSYATRFPILEATSGSGVSNTIVFTATDNSSSALVGVSDASFKRTTKSVTLNPTTITPGGALTVSVAGFTVDNGSQAGNNAEFTVTLGTSSAGTGITLTGTSTFPIGADGTGTGTVTIPSDVTAVTHYVKVVDNAATVNDNSTSNTATSNNSKIVSTSVPKGSVTADPATASTGNTVTLTGSNFPPNTTATSLTIGGANALPTGGLLTDASGNFSQLIEIPAATNGGSLSPGTQIIEATIGQIVGSSTEFSTPNPSITLNPAEAAVEETIVITGTGFNSLGTVDSLLIGSASAIPSPAPRAGRNGDITATVVVPLLNAGTYTVTMSNASAFSASTTFTAVAAKAAVASTADNTETVFADVIANDDNLVRVWRFSNADQSWAFFDPRPAFEAANTLAKTGAGDIVWVNVIAEEAFQGGTLFPGWNLISLN